MAEIYFSPNGGGRAAVVALIASAEHSVHVQCYMLTCPEIANALIAARGREVDVRVIHDEVGAAVRGCKIPDLLAAGVEVVLDGAHQLNHNKVMVVDARSVVTGSFNFTTAAEKRNAENLVVFRDDAGVARAYLDNWHRHRGHCVQYSPPAAFLPLLDPEALNQE